METIKYIYHHIYDISTTVALARSCFLHTVDNRYINLSILRNDLLLNCRNCCFYDNTIKLVNAQSYGGETFLPSSHYFIQML